ncbi:MAG TPA: hypothetical protein EYP10_11270 [Armatimonadetes bacterium]|nr:hypothetical protein [Armatimonadota bacterium]
MAKASAVLTVSESKRLIAKGVVALPAVQRALRDGMIAVAKGTTNSYVVEELLSTSIDKTAYTTGLTLPQKSKRPPNLTPKKLPDVVLKNGECLEGLSAIEAVNQMGAGDVFIKGANALDYQRKVAGILIGHPEGGTIGATLGIIVARRIELVIPIGLEKLVFEDIESLSRKVRDINSPNELLTDVPTLMPVTGTIVTEIEALKLLCNVDATLIAAGGIAGAEGSVRLLMQGDTDAVKCALDLIQSIQGEQPFTDVII